VHHNRSLQQPFSSWQTDLFWTTCRVNSEVDAYTFVNGVRDQDVKKHLLMDSSRSLTRRPNRPWSQMWQKRQPKQQLGWEKRSQSPSQCGSNQAMHCKNRWLVC
jgi:hypothetical protein